MSGHLKLHKGGPDGWTGRYPLAAMFCRDGRVLTRRWRGGNPTRVSLPSPTQSGVRFLAQGDYRQVGSDDAHLSGCKLFFSQTISSLFEQDVNVDVGVFRSPNNLKILSIAQSNLHAGRHKLVRPLKVSHLTNSGCPTRFPSQAPNPATSTQSRHQQPIPSQAPNPATSSQSRPHAAYNILPWR